MYSIMCFIPQKHNFQIEVRRILVFIIGKLSSFKCQQRVEETKRIEFQMLLPSLIEMGFF